MVAYSSLGTTVSSTHAPTGMPTHFPRVEESLMALGQVKFFSTLDLASGYCQVPVQDQDRICHALQPVTPQHLMERCLEVLETSISRLC